MIKLLSGALWVVALFATTHQHVHAQSPTSRAMVESSLTVLAGDSGVSVPGVEVCQGTSGADAQLCRAWQELTSAAASDDRGGVFRAEQRFGELVRSSSGSGLGWFGLGMARLQAARLVMSAREGPLQPPGVSNVAGAGHAMVKAIEADSTIIDLVLPALATMSIPREGASQLRGRLEMLRRYYGRLDGPQLVGAAEVERRAGDRAAAQRLLERALESGGVPPGLIHLELARELYAVGRPAEGASFLFLGAGDTATVSQARYSSELSWVATPDELTDWDAAAPEQRSEWLRGFWTRRDVAEGWPAGERLVEHYRRIEQAWQQFAVTLPATGRHRMSVRSPSRDMWVDQRIMQQLQRGEIMPPTDRFSVASDMEALFRYVDLVTAAGLGGPIRAYRTTQDFLDDRGVIWVRHGKPTRAAKSVGGEALEVWVYENTTPHLVLQFREEDFDGSAGATVLVPSLIDLPSRYRDQFCAIVTSLCALNVQEPEVAFTAPGTGGMLGASTPKPINPGTSAAGGTTTASITRAVNEGREQIVRATTTDGHVREFAGVVNPAVQFYGLRHFSTGTTLVTAFALPGEELAHTSPPEAGGRAVYQVRFNLSAVGTDGRMITLDTTRLFATAQPLVRGQQLTGRLELPLPPGRYLASVVVSQPDGRGAVARLDGIPVGSGSGVGISSVVLGARDQTVKWNSGRSEVALNPLNTFRRGSTAEMYYQITGLADGEEYRTRLEFVNPDDGKVALALRFDDRARGGGLQEVQRDVGLNELRSGRYQLKVTVERGGESTTETAWLVVTGNR